MTAPDCSADRLRELLITDSSEEAFTLAAPFRTIYIFSVMNHVSTDPCSHFIFFLFYFFIFLLISVVCYTHAGLTVTNFELHDHTHSLHTLCILTMTTASCILACCKYLWPLTSRKSIDGLEFIAQYKYFVGENISSNVIPCGSLLHSKQPTCHSTSPTVMETYSIMTHYSWLLLYSSRNDTLYNGKM